MGEERESLWRRLKAGFVFWSLWLVSTAIVATVRFTVEGWDRLEEAVADDKGGMLLSWHGNTVLPIYYCRNKGFYSIVSVSRDGELQNRLLRSRGFNTIRGSSARRGIRALLEATRALKDGKFLAHTPDGPKGPPKKVQPGTVYLAQRSGCPILPVGVACKPCRRLHSWDSHLVPLPFSKAALVFGEPLYITPDEDQQQAAIRIEDAINEAGRRADQTLT